LRAQKRNKDPGRSKVHAVCKKRTKKKGKFGGPCP